MNIIMFEWMDFQSWKFTKQLNPLSIFIFTITIAISIAWFLFRIKAKNRNSSSSLPPLPPGPRVLPFFGNLLSLNSELHSCLATLAQIYGPIFKLQLGGKLGIVLTSSSMAREALKDQDITFANHDVPAAARALTYGGRDVVWTPYGPEWRMLRKVCVVQLLSNRNLELLQDLREAEVRETVKYIYSQEGSEVNLGEQMFLTLLNVITKSLWGGRVEGEVRAVLGAEFREAISDMTELLGKLNVSDFYPKLARFDLQGIEKKTHAIALRFDCMFDKIINQRMQQGTAADGWKERKDFLQFLLQLQEEGDSKIPLTLNHIKGLLLDVIFGGSDTSANTCEFAMAEMMNNPEIMKRAQSELDSVIGKGNIVRESDITKLTYLQAVIKETLRLHPGVPLLVPRCPSETCTVGGYTVPKGSRVFVNVWAIHRDKSNWENPLKFDPSRFMNQHEFDFSGNEFKYLPFGSGRRICAGISLAERMIVFLVATMIHTFDLRMPRGEKVDMTEKFGIVMKKKIPLVAIPTPRLSHPALYQ